MIKLVETATKLSVVGDPAEIDQLVESFKYRPLGYYMSPSYQLFQSTSGKCGWPGFLNPMRRRTWGRGQPTAAEIPRGFLDDVLERCRARGFQLDTEGLLIRPFVGMSPEDIPEGIVAADFELDDLQRQAVAAWLENVVGINHATVSAGKTVMYAAAAAMIKRRYPKARFIYVTQSERLVRQVVAELHKFLPDWDITQFGGGVKDETGKDLVVVTVAMLNRHFVRLSKEGWFKTFYGLLFDESQHAGSPSSVKITSAIPAFFRLGASDSLCEDDPTRWNTIRGILGPVRFKITAGQLIKNVANSMASAGRLAKPHIYLVDVPEWKGKFKGVPHTPELDTEAYVLLEGQWKKGLYVGPVYDTDPESADGFKRDQRGELVTLDNYHRIVVDGQERSFESRWCLLERVRDRCVIRFQERNRLIAGGDVPLLLVKKRDGFRARPPVDLNG